MDPATTQTFLKHTIIQLWSYLATITHVYLPINSISFVSYAINYSVNSL